MHFVCVHTIAVANSLGELIFEPRKPFSICAQACNYFKRSNQLDCVNAPGSRSNKRRKSITELEKLD
jgi:hypothetical protein